ncbi:MAG: enolase C-terminal domain-like protein [Edaphobacter sp.]
MATINNSSISVYTVPTDAPESDGTFSWSSTTMVIVNITAGGITGLGYTYADRATAVVARHLLDKVIAGADTETHPALWRRMQMEVRNIGNRGIAAMAISAVDNALWDLRAKLHGLPLVHLLGAARESIPVYGSGGFTSYNDAQLEAQLGGWANSGFSFVKMKIGSHAEDDPRRVRVARKSIGKDVELFVDANGAYTPKQAIRLAQDFAESGVTWFEEPVSSDDLHSLAFIRERLPTPMEVAAGEYGYTVKYFQQMLAASAVDVLQADATRAQGITGFLYTAALCEAHQIGLSSHCAPSMHLHASCASFRVRHMEFFHDHVRIERMFFDGFQEPVHGRMYPDLSRSGHGLELKKKDIEAFAIA